MRRLQPVLLLLVVVFIAVMWQHRATTPVALNPAATPTSTSTGNAALPAFLPPEARGTLDAIARGGPFEHRQDGVVFGNYEGLLPQQPRGYYHEYTVETPGAETRGARRIITGGTPPSVYYYTADHYRSFKRFEVSR